MKKLGILFLLIPCFASAQDIKAIEIIEKYKETMGKERWNKTIIYKNVLPSNNKIIDATIFFNGLLGNVYLSVKKDSVTCLKKSKAKLEYTSWILEIKDKDTLVSDIYSTSGAAQFMLPDIFIANDTTTWHYKGGDTKEGKKVHAISAFVGNFALTLFFDKENYYLLAYIFELSKKPSSILQDEKTKRTSLKKSVFNPPIYGVFSDYRKVGNVLFPFKVVETVGTNKPHTTVFKDIRVSEDLLEDIFYIPQHLIDEKKAEYKDN